MERPGREKKTDATIAASSSIRGGDAAARRVLFISAGASHTVALLSEDLVCSWGPGGRWTTWPWRMLRTIIFQELGDFGRLGHGYSTDLFMPQSISMLKGLEIKQIACSDSHWLAITGDGDAFSWGRNQNGKLGLGHTDACNMPQKVLAFQGIAVTMLPVGTEHTVAVTESGSLGCLLYL